MTSSTAFAVATAPQALPSGTVRISGGTFLMGSDAHHAEERPQHCVGLKDFWMDETAVINAQFAAFVAATGYAMVTEHPLDAAMYPGADPAMLAPGVLVFRCSRRDLPEESRR